jgi:hypothetical protein
MITDRNARSDMPEGRAIAGAGTLRHRARQPQDVIRLPDGQIRSPSDCPLSSLLAKKFRFALTPNQI